MALDLQQINDRIEIEELLARYSRALDYRNFDELDSIFTPDAEFDAGGLGHPVGPADIRAMIEGTIGHLDATQHLIGKSLIEFSEDGDTAEVRTYLISQHIRESAPSDVKHYFLGGEYADRVVRTPDGWRIRYRRLDRMWKQGDRAVIGH
ncbi:MAG: nuclear transport factor 2 family protein [Actinomycetales bacterium]|nr:nuclear transport factor 2 family protein [Actinomycetales bacterium]